MNMRTAAMAALAMGLVTALAAFPASPARAAEPTVKCHLSFTLHGWSIIYKQAQGAGMVRCDNGQSAPVKISVIGGGLTAGKYRIDDGKGEITKVHGINEVFGDYVQASAEAGVVKSAHVQVLSKGTTSLALSGTGEGIDLGVSVGKFTISRR